MEDFGAGCALWRMDGWESAWMTSFFGMWVWGDEMVWWIAPQDATAEYARQRPNLRPDTRIWLLGRLFDIYWEQDRELRTDTRHHPHRRRTELQTRRRQTDGLTGGTLVFCAQLLTLSLPCLDSQQWPPQKPPRARLPRRVRAMDYGRSLETDRDFGMNRDWR